MKNISIIKSFYHALCGFRDAFMRERNLRVHLIVANLILVFATAYGIDRGGYAVLIATITLVVATELMNSAVEKAVDTITHECRFDAMHAKDFAAAATLACAVGAIGVGIALFGDIERIWSALVTIFTSPVYLVVYFILLVLDTYMLFYPKIRYERKPK